MILNPESLRWRTGLLLASAAMAVGFFFSTFQCSPIMPWCSTTMGLQLEFTSPVAGFRVAGVDNAGPAEAAGLRAGDRIDFHDIPFRERWRLKDTFSGFGGLVGERLRYVAHRGAQAVVAVVSPRHVAPAWPALIDWVGAISSCWILIFVVLLASRRPDSVDARLLSLVLLFFVFVNGLTGLFVPWPRIEFAIVLLAGMVFITVPVVCLTMLCTRVARPLSPARRVLAFLSIAGAVVFSVQAMAVFILGYGLAQPVFWLRHESGAYSVALIASLASAIAAARASQGGERARLFWIAASLSPVWLYYVVRGAVDWFVPQIPYHEFQIFLTLAFLLLPIGFTYAVLARRVVDLGYVVNRAAVFGVISLFVVGVFVIVEWAFNSWASSAGHTTNLIVNVAVALVLGLSLRFIHARVENVVDRLFFRKRHEDELALRRFAREAAYITKRDELLDRTVKVVAQHTEARRVELLILDGACEYVPVRGDDTAKGVDENDPAVLAMRTWHDSVDLHRYETALKGERAFPMSARGRLLGILVCGTKRGDEAYAPDEDEALAAVAQGVGSALEVLKSDRADAQSQMLDAQARLLDVQLKVLDELRLLSDRLR